MARISQESQLVVKMQLNVCVYMRFPQAPLVPIRRPDLKSRGVLDEETVVIIDK